MTEEQREAYKRQFGQEPPLEASVRFVEPSKWNVVEEGEEEEGRRADEATPIKPQAAS
jgi:hypothetical protein